jgi:2-hydroxychromene-2-carboxylate isomerase
MTAINSKPTPVLEFFFDCSSPWTYFAFVGIQTIAAEFQLSISWRPILVGGIFNTVNPSVYAGRENPIPAKASYLRKDLQDWSTALGIPIRILPSVFPVNSVKAMRGCILLQSENKMVDYARSVFEAYWRDDQDISQDHALAAICVKARIDPMWFSTGIASSSIKEALRVNTAELVQRGGFGSPTMFVEGTDIFFGNDRLPLVRTALLRRGYRIVEDSLPAPKL